MSIRKTIGTLLALTSVMTITPALAQYYVNPYYNHYGYRGYAPCAAYGYHPWHHDHVVRNVALGAGLGAVVGGAVGLLATRHGHRW
jgi:hypothetical protein